MLLFAYVVGISASYFGLRWLFELFFLNVSPRYPKQWLRSVFLIALAEAAILAVSYSLQNAEVGNRLEHTFGGGFVVVLACYLAVRDSRINVTPAQFFVLSGLLTTMLGVGNELLEFALQNSTALVFATTANDTWLDLTSNAVGTLIGATMFALLMYSAKRTNRRPE